MYRIIGGDGREYGPVTADQIRDWIREGRANAETRASGPDEEWRPLSSFGEFSDLLGRPATTPPAAPAAPLATPVDPVAGPRTFVELEAEPVAPAAGAPVAGAPFAGTPLDQAPAAAEPASHVTNWLLPAILATICCCLPTGIASIVFAVSANSRKKAGDWAAAQRAARNARLWFWTSVGIAVAGWLIGLLMVTVMRGNFPR